MNRRNVLIGLGGIAVGGGALLGSGAFSQVQANRDITIETSTDANAELELTPGSSDIASATGGAGDELTISSNDLNTDATTVYESVFEISHSSGSARHIAISEVTPNFGTLTFYAYSDANDDVGSDVNLSSEYVTLNSEATLTVGLEVVTQESASSTESTTSTATIEAAANGSDLNTTTSNSNETETT